MAKEHKPGADQSKEERQAIILEAIKNEPANFDEVIDLLPGHLPAERLHEIISQFERAAARYPRASQDSPLPDLIPNLLEDMAARYQAVKVHGAAAVGFPTQIKKLDKLLGGLQVGIHTVAAEPGAGKTSFVLQVGAAVARQGHPVLFLSFEEPLWKLTLKVICAAAGLEAKKFQDGYGNPEELHQAAAEYGSGLRHLYLMDGTQNPTIEHVKARALTLMEAAKLKKCLIIVDYLQIWAGQRRDFSDFRHVIDALVSDMRRVAHSLNSPVILVSSQHRGGYGKGEKGTVKESGNIEYSADSMWFLVKDEKRSAIPPDRPINLIIDKNRYGDNGKIDLVFKPHIGIFIEESKR